MLFSLTLKETLQYDVAPSDGSYQLNINLTGAKRRNLFESEINYDPRHANNFYCIEKKFNCIKRILILFLLFQKILCKRRP